MCKRPDLELDAEELDRGLLAAYRQWESLTRLFLGEDEMKELDGVEEFCSHARDRLNVLVKHRAAPEARAGPITIQHA